MLLIQILISVFPFFGRCLTVNQKGIQLLDSDLFKCCILVNIVQQIIHRSAYEIPSAEKNRVSVYHPVMSYTIRFHRIVTLIFQKCQFGVEVIIREILQYSHGISPVNSVGSTKSRGSNIGNRLFLETFPSLLLILLDILFKFFGRNAFQKLGRFNNICRNAVISPVISENTCVHIRKICGIRVIQHILGRLLHGHTLNLLHCLAGIIPCSRNTRDAIEFDYIIKFIYGVGNRNDLNITAVKCFCGYHNTIPEITEFPVFIFSAESICEKSSDIRSV